jgi:hypothetical protein
MTFEYKLPSRRGPAPIFQHEPATEPRERAPRVARLVALAHKLEALVRSRQVKDYAELARLAQISPSRIAQIILLRDLAPDIQEHILFLSAEHSEPIRERELRLIAREFRWDRQRTSFERMIASRR